MTSAPAPVASPMPRVNTLAVTGRDGDAVTLRLPAVTPVSGPTAAVVSAECVAVIEMHGDLYAEAALPPLLIGVRRGGGGRGDGDRTGH